MCRVTPWRNTQFRLVVQDCLQLFDCKEQFQAEEYDHHSKAIRVPGMTRGHLWLKPFSVVRLEHAKVDWGFHMIDRQA